ncbi:hypothetical protein [uncultured Thiodictyon sp.]|uniref:hypothetical protein n=1 Tax=uncultured Thiodictyon sp. TaxID=1846217 RepID=UPI0025FB4990|nr:hypothetical protein [uncultured Thiodictyon sp.]
MAVAARRTPPGVLILDLTIVPPDTAVSGFLAEMLGSPEVAPLLICTVEIEVQIARDDLNLDTYAYSGT